MFKSGLSLCCVLVSVGSTWAAEVAVPVVVREPVAIARRHEPASGGIPFLPGQVKDAGNLALVDATGKPVAAQFTKLAGYEDGSVQWALVDTMLDLPATWKRAGRGIEMSDKTGRTWPLIKIAQTFEHQSCVEPMARWAELAGDKEAEKVVIGMANAVVRYAWSAHCDHSISHPFMGLLGPGEPFDPYLYQESHKKCPANGGGTHSGFYSMFLVDVLMHAYDFNHDPKLLATAVHWWERCSKRGYHQDHQLAAKDEIYQSAGHDAPQGNHVDIRHCERLFYDVPRAQ